MTSTVITARNLGKKYLLGRLRSHNTLRDEITYVANKLLRRGDSEIKSREFWALQDLNFDVEQGEALGIIGHNGAGKSTLFKLLSQITEPTTGEIRIRGRVASLLEVGTGFHPELSGRENVYLNGAILGMTRSEIRKKFDEIVAFAEIDKFIDTPVKRYSSGMYVRLAFAVAAHLEQDIMVLDEVLAVGDSQFQRKCLGKMNDMTGGGRTILFVSHNMRAVQSICRRCLLLDHGRIRMQGETSTVVNQYVSMGVSSTLDQVWENPEAAPGNDKVRLHSVRLIPGDDDVTANEVTVWTPFRLEFRYWNFHPGARLNLSMHIYNMDNVLVFNSANDFDENWQGKEYPEGLYKTICEVPARLLNDEAYYVDLMVVKDSTRVIHNFRHIMTFEVREDSRARRGDWHGKVQGVVRPFLDWKTEQLGGLDPNQPIPDSVEAIYGRR